MDKLKQDDLKKVSGGKSDESEELYSFETGDTFLSGIIYYVVTQDYSKVKADTDIRVNKFSNPSGQYILHYTTAIHAETLKEKYQYLGKYYIKP